MWVTIWAKAALNAAELDLGLGDARLGDRCGGLEFVDLGPGDILGLQQFPATGVLGIRILRVGYRLGDVRLALLDHRLVLVRLNEKELIAHRDLLAFGELPFFQESLHSSPQLDLVLCHDAADELGLLLDRPGLGANRHHRGRQRGGHLGRLPIPASRKPQQDGDQQRMQRANHRGYGAIRPFLQRWPSRY